MSVRKPSEFTVLLFLATGATFIFNLYSKSESYRTEPLPDSVACIERISEETDDEFAPFLELDEPHTFSRRRLVAGFLASVVERTFRHTTRFGRDGLRAVSVGIDLRRFASISGGAKST